ncbi:uncharacterized protein [Littorina saxatilis]|uniref:uncharacterized protein n=1 Tax=Littorina saxatilis TaxID=31220 RepID=UPI0038B4E583
MKMMPSSVPKSLLLLVILTPSFTSAGVAFDSSVCTPTTPTVPLPVPAGTLGDVWQAELEWKDDVTNRTYFLRDFTDMPNKREKLVISIPFLSDVTVLYDWRTYDAIVETMNTTRVNCEVVKHSNTGGSYAYRGLFWLTSLQVLVGQFAGSRDAVISGPAMVRGIRAQNWTACIYDYMTNMTVRANLYFSERTWSSPYLAPNSQIPLRLEYFGRVHTGSQSKDISLVGDIVSFRKSDIANNINFKPDVFTTQEGAFCPNRTGNYKEFPSFPSGLSLLMEVIDLDNKHVTYEELFYDSHLRMVRHDYKLAQGGDPDPTSVIFDFQVGVKYIVDRHMMSCSSASPLVLGDNFVANVSLGMQNTADYFHSATANIQYVGQVTVRNVVCDTWVGQYFDQVDNRQNTVQWYFTTRKWWEAAGNSEGGGAFFMMKLWSGGSSNPKLYNVMRYNPSPPDFDSFDFSVCFDRRAKKHFTIEFAVGNVQFYTQLSRPYLKTSVVQWLAGRLNIQPNRFTDISFDLDIERSRLFMSATLLDRAIPTTFNRNEISLGGAFSFLSGSIDASHLSFNLTFSNGYITLMGVTLVEHNFVKEFATTTPTTPPTTRIVAPTIPLVPPKRTTAQPTLPPTLTPTLPATPPPTLPPTQSSSSSSSSSLPSPTCPPESPMMTSAPCSCPRATTPAPCVGQQRSASSATGISSGALAGGVVAALILGLVIGIIATRFYHVLKVNTNQMTINLIDENNI